VAAYSAFRADTGERGISDIKSTLYLTYLARDTQRSSIHLDDRSYSLPQADIDLDVTGTAPRAHPFGTLPDQLAHQHRDAGPRISLIRPRSMDRARPEMQASPRTPDEAPLFPSQRSTAGRIKCPSGQITRDCLWGYTWAVLGRH
jgi:hypothetical protein